MNVLAAAEDRQHLRVTGLVGGTAQFDLVVVSDDEDVAGAGDEEAADRGPAGDLTG